MSTLQAEPKAAPVWIMGCGDIGRRLLKLYKHSDNEVYAWVSRAESAQQGRALGAKMFHGDMDSPLNYPVVAMQDAALYWFAPPPPSGSQDTRLRTFLQQARYAPKRIVLISTTGVYGDCGGRWIDENEPLKRNHSPAPIDIDSPTK